MGVPAVSSAVESAHEAIIRMISPDRLIAWRKCGGEARVRRDLRAVWTHRLARVWSLCGISVQCLPARLDFEQRTMAAIFCERLSRGDASRSIHWRRGPVSRRLLAAQEQENFVKNCGLARGQRDTLYLVALLD